MNKRFFSNMSLIVGLVFVALIIITALISFIWTPYSPNHLDTRLSDSSPEHWLGTDQYGRDTLTWVMMGARITLYVGAVAVGIAVVIGVPLGILAGMTNLGWLSGLIMRTNDLLLAFPALLLAMIFAAALGPGTLPAMIAVGIASIPGFARVARSGTLQVMSREFIMAAKSANRSAFAIARTHVLPNNGGMVIVQCSVAFALAILAEAGLSFLGLGTQAQTPSWGRMLYDSQQHLESHPGLAIWPGIAIAIAVLGFNLLGDGLRDRLDPKLKGRS